MGILTHYTINWDYHHVFFAGINHLGRPVTNDMVDDLKFIEPDPRRMIYTPFGPLQTTLPAASYVLFYELLKLLPFDAAFSLPTVIIGSFGVLVLFLFLKQAIGFSEAVAGSTFLALYPRYWGDMHTNVKDIPTAVMYAIAIWLLWRGANYRKFNDILLAGLFFAITFNFKVNALLIPPIAGIWLAFTFLTSLRKKLAHPIHKFTHKDFMLFILYPLLSAGFSFAIWSFFWSDPIGEFTYLLDFFKDNTQNIEVLYFGQWFCSAVNTPWHYPFGYLAIVTPLPVLISVIIGIFVGLRNIRKVPVMSLFFLWFLIPLLKYVSPKIGVIDGIRHFEEVVFPLMAIAGIGAGALVRIVYKIPKISTKLKHRIVLFTSFIICIYLSAEIATSHPYQLTYFNELTGGRAGAMGKFDLDYWGVSNKQAMDWLNEHAKPNAHVYVVMTPDTAGKYLRSDLLKNMNSVSYDNSDYVVILNRQSFFYRYLFIWEYFLRRKPAYTVKVGDVPLAWVFDNSLGAFPRRDEWWAGEGTCVRKYWDSPIPKGTGSWKF